MHLNGEVAVLSLALDQGLLGAVGILTVLTVLAVLGVLGLDLLCGGAWGLGARDGVRNGVALGGGVVVVVSGGTLLAAAAATGARGLGLLGPARLAGGGRLLRGGGAAADRVAGSAVSLLELLEDLLAPVLSCTYAVCQPPGELWKLREDWFQDKDGRYDEWLFPSRLVGRLLP